MIGGCTDCAAAGRRRDDSAPRSRPGAPAAREGLPPRLPTSSVALPSVSAWRCPLDHRPLEVAGWRLRAWLALLLVSAMPMAQAGDAPDWQAWRAWTTRDGLPHNSVYALLQQRNGTIVAGTEQGAARYDGQRWQVLTLPRPLGDATIGALAEDGDGRLWFGTDRVGLWRDEAGSVPRRVELPAGAELVHTLLWTGESMLVGSSLGLHVCRRTCEAFDPPIDAGVRSLWLERDARKERLFVGTHGRGLVSFVRSPDSDWRPDATRLRREDGLPNDIVLAVTRFEPGGPLWIGTGRGVARWHRGRLTRLGEQEGRPAAMCFGLAAGRAADGSPVALAALRPGGIAEIGADGAVRLRDTRSGLPTQAVQALMYERHRGALWLATLDAGVLRAEAGHWALIDERFGLPNRLVTGIGRIDGRLWIGTVGGAVEWRDDRFAPLEPRLGPIQIHDVASGRSVGRWIATPSGVHRFDARGRHRHYTIDNSALPAVAARGLAVTIDRGRETVYIGTGHGLARWNGDDSGLEVVRGEGGWLDGAAILDLAGAGSTLALASSHGAGIARGDRLERIPDDCFGGDRATATSIAPDGQVLYATRGGRVVALRPERCETLAIVERIGSPSRLVADREFIMVFGGRGAERLDRLPTGAWRPGMRFGPADGLAHTEVVDATLDERGRIYAATSAGVFAFDPHSDPSTRVITKAPLAITAATFGEPPEPLHRGAALPPGTASVAFEYRLLSFEREHRHRYRVQLVGIDQAPRDWANETRIRFERLPPGHYRLVVEAEDADGVAAEPIEFAFSIRPWWWQRGWFALALALALVGLGVAAGRWRVRQAMRRAEALEDQVRQRTLELAAANAKLAALAVTDSLTGLPNRRFLTEILGTLSKVDRLLVGLIDIDHFKEINDTLGHDAGDAVLVGVARAIGSVSSGHGHALRWGGEEFLVLLPISDIDHAERCIRQMLAAIAAVPLAGHPKRHHVTASAGFTIHHRVDGPGAAADLGPSIARADSALYDAKRRGRDRAVCTWRADEPLRR